MDLTQEVITVVREIRARHEVAAGQKIDLVLIAPASTREILGQGTELIAQLTHASSLELTEQAAQRADAATAVVRDIEIQVPGILDLDKERAKLSRQRQQLADRITGTAKKLDNEQFVGKAPPEVVERERANLEALEAQVESIEARLRALDS